MPDDALDLTAGIPLDSIPGDGMVAGKVGDADVLLARWTDDAGRPRVSALDAKCTHRGAPLVNGIRVGDAVHCPFHHACFDLRSGEATIAPAIAPLNRWRVEVDGGVVTVADAAPADDPEADAPAPGTPEHVDDARGVASVVVIGGGAAGFAAVERLRREGFAGSIVLVAGEGTPPIDRTYLSKDYLQGTADATKLPMVPDAWYVEHDVDLRRAVTATAIDTAERTVSLSEGDDLGYDALVLATGAEPKRLDAPGFDRDEVHVLRTKADADGIVAALGDDTRVVIVGAGFIGLEAAASLRGREVAVTVVASSDVPLSRQLGTDLGRMVKGLHEDNGVRFVVGRAAEWTGSELRLEDGTSIGADLVLLGLGVEPRTALAEAAGLEVDDGIVVDAYGETQTFGVFAAGDVARYPEPRTGRLIRVEHWAVAQRLGALAAVNLLGGAQAFDEPAFFWTKHYSAQIRLAGHAESTEHAEVDGSIADREAVVTFREGGEVTAIAGVGRDHEVLELEQRLLREPAVSGA